MLIAVLWLLLAPAPGAIPTIGSLQGLRPAAIGEAVLKGRKHGITQSVIPDRGLDAPGVVRLKLTERPTQIPGGCLRRKWTASFYHELDAAESTAAFSDAHGAREVALPTPGCPSGEFAHFNPGLDIDQALGALRHLRDVRSGKAKVRFSCSDSTGSQLCRTPEMIRQELGRLPAWAVSKNGPTFELWLGKGGQAVTAVSFPDTFGNEVMVERRVPAPF